MTSYGAIPTSSIPGGATSTNLQYISRAKERVYATLETRKPWGPMFDYRQFGIPLGLSDAFSRFRENGAFFLPNYLIIVLCIVFVSLLWHPVSLIVFLVMLAAWIVFYFSRDEPIVFFGRAIDNRIVVFLLGVLTLMFLLLTGVTVNVVSSLAVGIFVVVLHGVIRKTDDLSLDAESGAGLIASSST